MAKESTNLAGQGTVRRAKTLYPLSAGLPLTRLEEAMKKVLFAIMILAPALA
jgi:hypothetical protein